MEPIKNPETISACNRQNGLSAVEDLCRMLEQMQTESNRLYAAIRSEQELEQAREAVRNYEKEMDDMQNEVQMHLEIYRETGWKEIIFGEDYA